MGRATKQTSGKRPTAEGWKRREAGFTAVENTVFTDKECSKDDIMVYLALSNHANRQGFCFPSLATICRLSRSSKTTVLKSIHKLELKEYIRKAKGSWDAGRRRSNEYTLLLRPITGGTVTYRTQVPNQTPMGTPAYQEQLSLEKDTKKKNQEWNRYEQFLNNLTLPFKIGLNRTVLNLLKRLEADGLLDPSYFQFVCEREKTSGYLITALQVDQYRTSWVKQKTKCSECGCFDLNHSSSCSVLATLKQTASRERQPAQDALGHTI